MSSKTAQTIKAEVEEQTRRSEEIAGQEEVPAANADTQSTAGSTFADVDSPNPEAYNNIIKKATTNPRYRRRLISDPKTVLREAGIIVPSGVEIRVRPFEEDTRYIFLPSSDPSIAQAIEATSAMATRVATESGREASVGINWWSGVVLTLEHEEVVTVLQYIQTGQDVVEYLKSIGIGISDLAFKVVALYLRIMAGLIRSFDHGNGVYLTMPWPAIWWQQWWLIIPGPR